MGKAAMRAAMGTARGAETFSTLSARPQAVKNTSRLPEAQWDEVLIPLFATGKDFLHAMSDPAYQHLQRLLRTRMRDAATIDAPVPVLPAGAMPGI